MIELQSEIDNWKDKHNRTQDEVAKLKVKYSLDKFRQVQTNLDQFRHNTHCFLVQLHSSGLIIFSTSFQRLAYSNVYGSYNLDFNLYY